MSTSTATATTRPQREGSPAHTAELRLVDVVTSLSRLEVQMAKDIDHIRHTQVASQLKGLTSTSSNPTAYSSVGGAHDGDGLDMESTIHSSSAAPPPLGPLGGGGGGITSGRLIPQRIIDLRASR